MADQSEGVRSGVASQFLNRLAKTQQRSWLQQTYERLTALVIATNFALVLFDLSYVAARDFWLQGQIEILGVRQLVMGSQRPITIGVPILAANTESSFVTRLYDPIKGIALQPETQQYLDLVDQLQDVALQQGLESAEAENLLAQLRANSIQILDRDPFRVADKSGRLIQIQNRMLAQVPNNANSANESFEIFWTADYLSQASSSDGIPFFESEIRPLFETNYSRPIGENGAFVDFFAVLDGPFVLFFFGEFLLRTWFISRRYTAVLWREALLWRWYDIFLFLPVLRIMRCVPLLLRLDQADILKLKRVKAQISQGFAAVVGSDISEIVVLRVLNQAQKVVQRGDLTRLIAQPGTARAYIDLNGVNELEALATLLAKTTVYKVLPQIRPEVEAIIRHNLDGALQTMPGYRQWSGLPGFSHLPEQMSERLAGDITQGLYTGLMAAFEDPVSQQLFNQLASRFLGALRTELGQPRPQQEIESLLVDLLEEIKLNYVEQLSEEDVEEILEQTRVLHQQVENRSHRVLRRTREKATPRPTNSLLLPGSPDSDQVK